MLGLFFILVVSNLLLYSTTKLNLDSLGLMPRFSGLAYFSDGLTTTTSNVHKRTTK